MSNLEILIVDTDLDVSLLLKILHRNKNTLKIFYFMVHDADALARFQGIWENVPEMEQLTKFEIENDLDMWELADAEEYKEYKVQLDLILSVIGKS